MCSARTLANSDASASHRRRVADYLRLHRTRLNQIDLETVDPVHFAEEQHVDVALGNLHMWRRFIPVYREMIAETLQHVFRFPCDAGLVSVGTPGNGTGGAMAGTPSTNCPVQTIERSNPADDSERRINTTSGRGTPSTSTKVDRGTGSTTALRSSSSTKAYEQDFKLILQYLEGYQMRINRLTSVVTAVMAVDDTRRAINDARNIGRLT